MLIFSSRLALSLLIGVAVPISATQPAPPLKLLFDPVISVDIGTGHGQTTALLHNYSPQAIVASLYVSPQNGTQRSAPLSLQLSDDKGAHQIPLEVNLAGGSTVPLTISVDEYTSSGEVQFTLSDTRTVSAGVESDLGHIVVRRSPVDVKVQSVTGEKLKLALTDGESATLAFQNNDLLPHKLKWAVSADGTTICFGDASLRASELTPATCLPKIPWSPAQLQGFLKDAPDRNDLLVHLSAVDSSSRETELKALPVTGNLNFFGIISRQAGNYALIVSVLVLGGLSSLLLGQLIPNRLQRYNLQEFLKQLSFKTADLSTRIDSRLAVLVRLERRRLSDVLRSRSSFSPDFAGVAADVLSGGLRLRTRVGLLEQLDSVLGRLDKISDIGAPLTQVETIDKLVDQASVLLSKAEAGDADIASAQTWITQASGLVDVLNQRDLNFSIDLARKLRLLKRDIDGLNGSPTYVRLLPTFNGLVQALGAFVNTLVANDPEPVPQDRYTELDLIYIKLSLAREYIVLTERIPDPAVRQRLLDHERKLIEYLISDNFESIRRARLLVREMKEDIYPERLQEALQAGQVFIRMDPDIAYEMASLEFCLSFQSALLDSSSAREEWICKWTFGDSLEGNGWILSHYYQLASRKEAQFPVVAELFDGEGAPVKKADGSRMEIRKDIPVHISNQRRGLGERSIIEGLKLGAALLIAVFGLVAGARDQLAKLDILPGLVGIFLIGFGADTIKNLLAPKDVRVATK